MPSQLARADTQVRPYIDQIEYLVGGHLCVPPEGAEHRAMATDRHQ